MLMRFDPFAELDRLTRENFGNRPAVMPMDAYRHGEHFVVRFDLPGADPETIDLTVEKNVLTVRAERSWAPEPGDEVVVAERPQGTFTRQLFLGETLDADHIEARYDHGVLNLTIPVAEKAKPRKVAVTSGSSTATSIETGRDGAIDTSSRASNAA
jgi:HSP20 family protein